MQVALLGTGTMGAGMARSMVRGGLQVRVWNRTRSRADPLAADGAQACDSIAAACEGVDVVLTMLFDAEAVLGVTDEVVGALGNATIWLQASTVGPDGIARIARRAGAVALLDAPMLGTRKPAEEGTLVPLVSGPADLIERARPVLDAVGARTVVAGDHLGQASALKLACNAWILSITAATAQSVALATAQGLDGRLFLDAIGGGPSDSQYAQLKGTAMLAGDFTPSFGLDGGRKDLGLIAEAARAAGVDTRLVDAVRAGFDTAADRGHGADDLAAVYTAFTAR